jgi:hypothetical protein
MPTDWKGLPMVAPDVQSPCCEGRLMNSQPAINLHNDSETNGVKTSHGQAAARGVPKTKQFTLSQNQLYSFQGYRAEKSESEKIRTQVRNKRSPRRKGSSDKPLVVSVKRSDGTVISYFYRAPAPKWVIEKSIVPEPADPEDYSWQTVPDVLCRMDFPPLSSILSRTLDSASTSPRDSREASANGEITGTDDMPKRSTKERLTLKSMERQIQILSRKAKNSVPKVQRVARRAGKTVNMVAKTINTAQRAASSAEDFLQRYVAQSIHPNDRSKPVIGVPEYPLTDSFKVRGYIDFTVNVGSNAFGSGVIAFNPALASDQNCIVASTGAYASNVIPALNSAAAGLTGYSALNLPFAGAALNNPALQGRIVSAGIEMRSIAPALNESGIVYAFTDPNNGNIAGLTGANLASRKGCVVAPLRSNREYHTAYAPTASADVEYGIASLPILNNGAQVLGAIVIVNGGTTAFSVYCRYTVVVEYNGVTADFAATENEVPGVGGFEHCAEAISRTREIHASNPHLKPNELVRAGSQMLTAIRAGRSAVKTAVQISSGLSAGFAAMRSQGGLSGALAALSFL